MREFVLVVQLSDEQLADFKEAFAAHDPDGSGVIQLADLGTPSLLPVSAATPAALAAWSGDTAPRLPFHADRL